MGERRKGKRKGPSETRALTECRAPPRETYKEDQRNTRHLSEYRLKYDKISRPTLFFPLVLLKKRNPQFVVPQYKVDIRS